MHEEIEILLPNLSEGGSFRSPIIGNQMRRASETLSGLFNQDLRYIYVYIYFSTYVFFALWPLVWVY